MSAIVTYLDPQPRAEELPARMPSPFRPGPPHPLACRAAEQLQTELAAGLGRALALDAEGGGKMFGVLVVADGDRIGFLRAVSGMVAGSWELPGFVPPAFDPLARDEFWIAGERELDELAARIDAVTAEAVPVRESLAALAARHAHERAALVARHRAARDRRRASRLVDPGSSRALDRESSADSAERRAFDRRCRDERAALEARLGALDDARVAVERARAARSRGYLERIHDTYAFANARGEVRTLRELFAPAAPPGGAGDCAAPKLLAFAHRHRLRPLALAELWWGAPPPTGGRHAGLYYPACRGKCGPILAHVLDGIAEPPPVFGGGPIADDEPHTVFEDRWLAVVAKPAGLLSVPGRGRALADSVTARLRVRYPDATGPVLVHRLDLDTSGLLIAAKDPATHAALQRLFARREIEKRYVAWLEGDVSGDCGVVELPLRVDLDDRPRQIVDRVHGRPAVTQWQVLRRAGGRTRVALYPRTGRAHQLRVHAAHPGGIGAPIVGDRLYGRPDARLLLHAEALGFVHPHTREKLTLTRPAPF